MYTFWWVFSPVKALLRFFFLLFYSSCWFWWSKFCWSDWMEIFFSNNFIVSVKSTVWLKITAYLHDFVMKVSAGWPCCVRLNIHTNHVANLVLIWPCFNKTTTLQRNQVLWRYFISLTNLYCCLLFPFAKGLKGYCILCLYSASHCHLFLLSGYAFQPDISCGFFLLHEDFKIVLGKTFIFIKVFIKRLNYKQGYSNKTRKAQEPMARS